MRAAVRESTRGKADRLTEKGRQDALASRCASQQAPADSAELRREVLPPHPHFFGRRDAHNLFPADRGIILLAAIAARDEDILLRVGNHQAVQAESHLALHQNNVSLAQLSRRNGFHMYYLAIANRGRHAAAARLKTNAIPTSQQFPADAVKQPRLRTIFGETGEPPEFVILSEAKDLMRANISCGIKWSFPHRLGSASLAGEKFVERFSHGIPESSLPRLRWARTHSGNREPHPPVPARIPARNRHTRAGETAQNCAQTIPPPPGWEKAASAHSRAHAQE